MYGLDELPLGTRTPSEIPEAAKTDFPTSLNRPVRPVWRTLLQRTLRVSKSIAFGQIIDAFILTHRNKVHGGGWMKLELTN
jgi:hypothetical protein